MSRQSRKAPDPRRSPEDPTTKEMALYRLPTGQRTKGLLSLALLAGMLALAGASTSLLSSYQAAKSTKIIFNKRFFYNNAEPLNSIGCAGDTKAYFDPQLDRQAPVKPSWLKNVSVDLTNANAPFGSSRSIFCSYGSASSSAPPECQGPFPPAYCSGTPPPSNCAAFDDKQSLTGYQTKAYLIGGIACETTACQTVSDQIYAVTINDTTGLSNPISAVTITRSPSALNQASTAANAPVFGAWAFDEEHDWLFGLSGATGAGAISSAVQRLAQNPAPTSTADPSIPTISDVSSKIDIYPGVVGIRADISGTFAGIVNANIMTNPMDRVGSSLTYIPRRSSSVRRSYVDGAGNAQSGNAVIADGSNCDTTLAAFTGCILQASATPGEDAEHGWEDSDFFLSIGGISNGVAGSSALSSTIAALLPHRLSRKISSNISDTAIDALSWEWLNHFADAPATAVGDANLMPIVKLSTDGTIPTSWTHTDRFETPQTGIFRSRAHHRAVYDPRMNRVYIFGGIVSNGGGATDTTDENDVTHRGDLTAAGRTLIPTTETWIYDVADTMRPPTLACRTSKSVITGGAVNESLPGLMRTARGATASANMIDFRTFPPSLLAYEQADAISPPGGCLQYAQPVTASPAATPSATPTAAGSLADDYGLMDLYTPPPRRFEQAMAFDERQGVIIMFGGCNNAPNSADVTANGLRGPGASAANTNYFDPTRNCTGRTDFLNDTWLFVPPDMLESALVVPSGSSSATYTFGRPDLVSPLDPALLTQPLEFNSGASTPSGNELQAHTNGTWIRLNADDGATSQGSGTYPLARASAAFWYDKSHGKFYMFGGKTCSGCTTGNESTQLLNDLWEFTPPTASECARSYTSAASEIRCASSGTWRMVSPGTDAHSFKTGTPRNDHYPPPTMAAAGVYATRAPGDYDHYGDGFYTISDGSCAGQGPVMGSDATSKERVGAVYIDIDRSQFASTENLLINIKMMPFSPPSYDQSGIEQNDGTKLPGYHFNGTYGASTADDHDTATESDRALLRVLLMVNPINSIDALFTQLQPRFRSYQAPGTALVAQEFDLAASGTGQPTEKQIFVPLSLDSRINLIKIERVRGTVKLYDMTVTKF